MGRKSGGGGARMKSSAASSKPGGGARMKSSAASSKPAKKSSAHPPAPVPHAPPPAVLHGNTSVAGGVAATIADGLAFGTGSAIAHRAADAIMGPRVVQHEMTSTSADSQPRPTAAPADTCRKQVQAFQDCIATSADDISKCQFYVDMLSECRRNAALSV